MKKKFLIFDLDGTLINPQTQELFVGVPEFIKKMSQWYTLFVSTRSSDEKAREILKTGKIYEYFDTVIWWSVMEKWPKHIEIFEMLSESDSFNQKTVFIGDSDIDRTIADDAGIPFIKIGKEWKDYYEADWVVNIEEIIRKIK